MDNHGAQKMQTWIVVLLSWMIVLLMFGIGYMVYTNREAEPPVALTGNELALACTDVVKQAIAAQPTTPSVVCATEETYSGFGDIRFAYPLDWEVFAQTNEEAAMTIIRLSADPLWLCSGCDGPGNAISVRILENTATKSLDTVVAETYTVANGYSNITKSASQINGKTVLTVKGTFDGLGSGPIEEIIYVTPLKIVIVENHNWTNDVEVEAAWNVLAPSLDFTAIK